MEIKSKEVLLNEICENKDEISSYLRDYLKCLLDLEFNPIREYINSKDRSILELTNIYNDVFLYNLFYRMKWLLDTNGLPLAVYNSKNGFDVYDYEMKKNVKLFEFFHMNNPMYKIFFVHLNLNQYVQTISKQEVLDKLESIITQLKSEKNPYPHVIMPYMSNFWEVWHQKIIDSYEEGYLSICNYPATISSDESKVVEVTEKIYEALMNEFDISQDDFSVQLKKELTEDYCLSETIVKDFPKLSLRNTIKYL